MLKLSAPDCTDCPTPAECKAANDCKVLRQIRHPETRRQLKVIQTIDGHAAMIEFVGPNSYAKARAMVKVLEEL